MTNYFTHLSIIEFCLIVLSSFGVDFDFIFRNFEKKDGGNHRNFITHTIYPGLIIFCIGLIIAFYNYHVIWICGISYLSHILFDCVDTGLRLFFTEKYYGWFVLITQDEKNLGVTFKKVIEENISKDEYFILRRYFKNSITLFLDITVSIIGFAILFTFASEFWWIYIGFFLLLEYHLHEKKKASRVKEVEVS